MPASERIGTEVLCGLTGDRAREKHLKVLQLLRREAQVDRHRRQDDRAMIVDDGTAGIARLSVRLHLDHELHRDDARRALGPELGQRRRDGMHS